MALKKAAERQRESLRESRIGLHELTHHGGNHPVGDSRGKHGGPFANSRDSGPHAAGHAVTGAAKKRERERLVHQAADLTPAPSKKQTKVRQAPKPAATKPAPDTSADVRQRPPTSGESPPQRLIDRIDIAIQQSGIKSAQVAREIGIQPQGLTNMRRKPNAGMHHELIAKAARVLVCDLHWLLTGEGGTYVRAQAHDDFKHYSRLTIEVAKWIEELSVDDQLRAWAVMAQIRQGHWPSFRAAAEALSSHEKTAPPDGTK